VNRSRWIAVAAGVAIVAAGIWWIRSRGSDEKPRYRTASVERGYIETVVSATGTIRPVEQVDVGSQVSGTVSKLYVDYNSRVSAGQVLCQLEPSSFRARLAQAEAAVARAQAALLDAQRVFKRSKELLPENYISQAEVDAAEVAVAQRQADLKQAQAQLESAQVDLNNSTIRAPISGVVIARSIELGQTVAASLQAPTMFVIANDLTQMQVETRIDEADIGQIHPGLPVLFTVDAFPDLTFQGSVSQVRLEPITEQNVVTYTTVIRTQNKELKLRPGMTANVSVRVASRDNVLKVPNAALRFRPPPGSVKEAGASPARRAETGPIPSLFGVGTAYAADKPDDLGRAELEKRMKERGMPDQAIQSILERRDEAIADMRKQGMSDDEIRERLRQRMEQMRAQGGGQGGGFGGTRTPSFRNFDKQQAPGAGAKGAGSPARRDRAAGGSVVMGAPEPPVYKPGNVYLLRAGAPVKVAVMTGLSDGAYTEVQSDLLKEGDAVIVGLEMNGKGPATTQLPPGMGSPFGGGGRRR